MNLPLMRFKNNQSLGNQEQKKFLFKDVLIVKYGQWQKLNLNDLLPEVQEWGLIKFHLARTRHQKQLIAGISNIAFPNLTHLSLSFCWIQSIEGFCNFYMPNLKSLLLNDNAILNLKSIRKNIWTQLQVLDISENFIRQAFGLFELASPDFCDFFIEKIGHQSQKCKNISMIAKLETFSLRTLSTMCLYQKELIAQLESSDNKKQLPHQTKSIKTLEFSTLTLFTLPLEQYINQ